MTKSKLLSSSGILLLLAVSAVLLGKQQFSQWQKQRLINKEIAQLKNQEAQYSKENKQLSDSLSFLGTSDYKEQIAREQLNLKKDGELVVNFPDHGASGDQATDANITQSSNFEKWWTYLFKKSK